MRGRDWECWQVYEGSLLTLAVSKEEEGEDVSPLRVFVLRFEEELFPFVDEDSATSGECLSDSLFRLPELFGFLFSFPSVGEDPVDAGRLLPDRRRRGSAFYGVKLLGELRSKGGIACEAYQRRAEERLLVPKECRSGPRKRGSVWDASHE